MDKFVTGREIVFWLHVFSEFPAYVSQQFLESSINVFQKSPLQEFIVFFIINLQIQDGWLLISWIIYDH